MEKTVWVQENADILAWERVFYRTLNQALETLPLPPYPLPAPEAEDLPLYYIVGLPRSGTTLCSQLISSFWDIGYINNLIARFWLRPGVGITLSQNLLGPTPPAFLLESREGRTEGPAGPHEFAFFWEHWFGFDKTRTHNLTPAELARVDKTGFRQALHEILSAFRKPVVFKNMFIIFLAGYLKELHPRSFFFLIERPFEDVCRSMLHARERVHGSQGTWFALRPAAWPFEAQNPCEEVVLQCLYIEQELKASLAPLRDSCVHLLYRDLCENPYETLEQARQAAEQALGHAPAWRSTDLPSLAYRPAKPLAPLQEKQLFEALEKHRA